MKRCLLLMALVACGGNGDDSSKCQSLVEGSDATHLPAFTTSETAGPPLRAEAPSNIAGMVGRIDDDHCCAFVKTGCKIDCAGLVFGVPYTWPGLSGGSCHVGVQNGKVTSRWYQLN